jgi:RNA polymerase sigma-70 factor (ECF subfamily)
VTPFRELPEDRRDWTDHVTTSGTARAASQVDDAAVIAASRTQPERFSVLFDAYYADIHRYAGGRLGADLADDVVSETFLVAFRERARFDVTVGARALPWLYGIATNVIRRHRRSEQRLYRALGREGAAQPVGGYEEMVTARVSAQAMHRDLAAALAGLSARDRDVLLLVALGGLDYGQTAVALGIPYGTVCSRLSRARRKLRQVLGGRSHIDERDR